MAVTEMQERTLPVCPKESVEKRHESLYKSLLALRRVASMQLEAETPRAWEAILEQKQFLLDKIDSLNLEALFLQTRWLLSTSAKSLMGKAETIARRQEENIALVEEVSKIETAAEERLQGQLRELHQLLAKNRHDSKISSAYSGGLKSTRRAPRFVDMKR